MRRDSGSAIELHTLVRVIGQRPACARGILHVEERGSVIDAAARTVLKKIPSGWVSVKLLHSAPAWSEFTALDVGVW